MSVQEELLAIEETLWTGGPADYQENLSDECLLAFTGMVGVYGPAEVAATVEGGPRWRDLELVVEGLVQPTDDVAVLTYRAAASRGDDERYRARVSSAYVRSGGAWKLMFHQQTPLPAD